MVDTDEETEQSDKLSAMSLEVDHDDDSSASSASSTGTIRPLPSRNLFARPQGSVWPSSSMLPKRLSSQTKS